MPDTGDGRDDEQRTFGSAGGPMRDPLLDTMPWTFDDDPVAEKLRAWRGELQPEPWAVTDPSSPSALPESSADPSPTGPSATLRGSTDPTEVVPAQAPVGVPPARADDEASQARAERGRPMASQRAPDNAPQSAPWPLNRIVRRRVETELVDQRGSALPHPMPRARHAAWDVISSEPVPPLPPISPADLANAAARTVAFPALDLVPVAEDGEVEYAIEVDGLRKSFKDFVAVDGVSFRVPKGKVFALLGPNGAGKTTIVNMLCTLLRPSEGRAEIAGCDVVGDPAGVRRSIMLTGQFAALDESLTGRENLVMFGRLMGLRKAAAVKRAGELLEVFGLEYASGRKVREYSGGMRRRIDIACGLVTAPKVVFLDEPTTGLDPRSRQDVWSLVEQLRAAGVTVLLTTQYLEEADLLSDNIVVIDKGKVIAEGSSDQLKEQIGAAYCEITPAHPAYLPRLRAKLTEKLGMSIEEENDRISVPAPAGAETLAQVIACTSEAKIPLADISLRRPSLDEVFFALTDADGR